MAVQRITAPLLVAAALLLVPPIAYVGSYRLLAAHGYTNYGARMAQYKYGGKAAEMFFKPLELADRRLRPGQWESLCVQLVAEPGP